MKQFLIALKATLVLTLLTGLMYPLLVTGLAKVLFPHQAEGSLIRSNGRIVGSELIGQRFTKPEYFHGRPSAAGNDGYDGLNSGGSNLGPTSQKLADRVSDDVKKFRAENPTFSGAVPGDAVTASGSGLDPHLSPEAVDAQVPRVAAARGMSVDALRQVVAANTEDRQVGVLGEPRVNILKLNIALDTARQSRDR
jgi:potassium-transporting ATPase KdpC subunit